MNFRVSLSCIDNWIVKKVAYNGYMSLGNPLHQRMGVLIVDYPKRAPETPQLIKQICMYWIHGRQHEHHLDRDLVIPQKGEVREGCFRI